MAQRFCQCLLAGLFMVCLLLAAPQPVSATIVFDDHFDGESGGMPAGWFLAFGTGSVVEWGTVVDLLDSKVVIGSDSSVDPSVGTVSLVVQVAGASGAAGAGAGFFTSDLASHFGFLLDVSDGQVYISAEDAEGGEQNYIAGYLSGYTGGPICVTLELGPTAFRISTDSPPFDSGSIQYADVFPTFTRDDLGPAASLFLVNDVEPGEWGSSSFDRITVDVGEPTPVKYATFGQIKALYRP
jgi:hypothetical protein